MGLFEKKNKPMKNLIQNGLLVLFSALIISACDNGFADIPIVDTAPSIQLGAITSGTTEDEDFVISVTLKDAVEGSKISSLGELDYVITSGGASIASGKEVLTGWTQTVTIRVAGGFPAGDYNFDVTARDSNGNSSVDNVSFTVAPAKPAFDITGVWSMEQVPGSLAVGPGPGTGDFFSINAGQITTRACFYDDTYTFEPDGTFKIDMGDATWLEPWQGVNSDACGTPIAPFDGKGSYTYSYSSTSLTLVGVGAHVGLAKVFNNGELAAGDTPANQITYTIADQSQTGNVKRMTLHIQVSPGAWWTFKLISGADAPAATTIEGNWKIAPEAGAFVVGDGNQVFFSNPLSDVTGRDCLFDDIYTFDANGDFSIEMGNSTWLEPWQGVSDPTCGTPLAPHDGAGTYTYELSGGKLKLIGTGAHVVLPKAVNGGELPNVPVPNEVTYDVLSLTSDGTTKRMVLEINVGGSVRWTFTLVSA